MQMIFEIIKLKQVRVLVDHPMAGVPIHSPEKAAEFATSEIGDDDREVLLLMILNTKNEVVASYRCHVGSLNASIVHPREVFKAALLNNAASIIISHNHPSGDVTPSREDIAITQRLVECGKMLGVEVLDHTIVSHTGRFTSLKEKGYI